MNVYGVIVGLRTFPIAEKPLVATGGSKDDTTPVAGGTMGDERNPGL